MTKVKTGFRKMINPVLCMLGVFVFTSAAVHGQEAEKVKLEFRTLCTSTGVGNVKMHIQLSEEETLDVPLYGDSFSQVVKYEGPAKVLIRFNESEPTEYTFPKGLKKIVLLCIPKRVTEKNKSPYIIKAFSLADESFPYGSRKLINLTSGDVGLMINKKNYGVKAGSAQDLNLRRSQVEDERFAVTLFDKVGKDWKKFSATRWSLDKTKRTFIFFYSDPQTKRTRYRAIPDYYVDEEAVKKAEEAAAAAAAEPPVTPPGPAPPKEE